MRDPDQFLITEGAFREHADRLRAQLGRTALHKLNNHIAALRTHIELSAVDVDTARETALPLSAIEQAMDTIAALPFLWAERQESVAEGLEEVLSPGFRAVLRMIGCTSIDLDERIETAKLVLAPERFRHVLLSFVSWPRMTGDTSCEVRVAVRAKEESQFVVEISVEHRDRDWPVEEKASLLEPPIDSMDREGQEGMDLFVARAILEGVGGQIELDEQFESGLRIVAAVPVVETPEG